MWGVESAFDDPPFPRPPQTLDHNSAPKAVLTSSRHMRDEYARHGISTDRLHLVPLFPTGVCPDPSPPTLRPRSGRVLFVGRITPLKGWRQLLEAIPQAAAKLSIPLTLVIAGDGPDYHEFKAEAQRKGILAEFLGWVGSEKREAEMRAADVLVVPSVWPEPFGLVGIEAGCVGLPAVAFAVGGIPDWLEQGTSGELAPGNPPTSSGLADALVRALAEPRHLARLGAAPGRKPEGSPQNAISNDWNRYLHRWQKRESLLAHPHGGVPTSTGRLERLHAAGGPRICPGRRCGVRLGPPGQWSRSRGFRCRGAAPPRPLWPARSVLPRCCTATRTAEFSSACAVCATNVRLEVDECRVLCMATLGVSCPSVDHVPRGGRCRDTRTASSTQHPGVGPPRHGESRRSGSGTSVRIRPLVVAPASPTRSPARSGNLAAGPKQHPDRRGSYRSGRRPCSPGAVYR